MNTSTSRTYPNHSTGETSQVLTMFLGLRINIFLPTAAAAGHKEPPAPLLIALTLPEIELGLIFHCLLKLSSIAKPEEAAMEVILEESMPSLSPMEFLKKPAKTIWLRILINSVALPSKNAKTAPILKAKSQEIKETAGPLLAIPFGKSTNMEQFQVLTT